jgi:hypothetical protein
VKIEAEENLELRRYLLRELSEEESLTVSARLFLEEEYSAQLRAVEEDLVDDYVYEELSADERQRFETYFLAEPERAEDLKIAQALKDYISTEPDASPLPDEAEEKIDRLIQPHANSFPASLWAGPPALKLLLAAAVLLIVVGGAWLILKSVRRQDQPGPVQAHLPTPQGGGENSAPPREENGSQRQEANKNPQDDQQQQQQVARNNREAPANVSRRTPSGNDRQTNREAIKPQPPRQKITYALLIPYGVTRDEGGLDKVELSGDTRIVNFQLALINKDNGGSYQVTLQTDDGKTIRTLTGLKSTVSKAGEIVSISMPASLFDQQNYSMSLKALNASGSTRDIGKYSFRILKRPPRAQRLP